MKRCPIIASTTDRFSPKNCGSNVSPPANRLGEYLPGEATGRFGDLLDGTKEGESGTCRPTLFDPQDAPLLKEYCVGGLMALPSVAMCRGAGVVFDKSASSVAKAFLIGGVLSLMTTSCS